MQSVVVTCGCLKFTYLSPYNSWSLVIIKYSVSKRCLSSNSMWMHVGSITKHLFLTPAFKRKVKGAHLRSSITDRHTTEYWNVNIENNSLGTSKEGILVLLSHAPLLHPNYSFSGCTYTTNIYSCAIYLGNKLAKIKSHFLLV